jgi:hypothetical protein
MLDKYDFVSYIAEQFEGLQSKEEIEVRAEKMINLIIQSKEIAKNYLEVGIL